MTGEEREIQKPSYRKSEFRKGTSREKEGEEDRDAITGRLTFRRIYQLLLSRETDREILLPEQGTAPTSCSRKHLG